MPVHNSIFLNAIAKLREKLYAEGAPRVGILTHLKP
jgi:hypothetical protein